MISVALESWNYTLPQRGDQVTKPSWTCIYNIRAFAQFSSLSLGILFCSLYFCMRPFDQGMPRYKAVLCIAGHPGSIPAYGCIAICHYETENHLKHPLMILLSLWLQIHHPLCSLVRWAMKIKQIIGRTGIFSFLTIWVTKGVHDLWTLCNLCMPKRICFCQVYLNLTLNHDSRTCELSSYLFRLGDLCT